MTEPASNAVTLQKSIDALGADLNSRLDAMVTRMDRIDRAVVGEEVLGHVGLVERMRQVEEDRKSGDARLHQRLDQVEDELAAEREKWQRFKALAWGIGIGSGVATGGVWAAITSWLG